ncbi:MULTISPECIES: hypothetical protein [unclassified Streptomyces]|uniref:hypothetical protein n=1 Tax=unclassified Streptomyces TaxID=2593676 RepID=UPI0022566690|nr:hypothetical protein [Streptomyces sp. NBC_00047]MCX5606900.1 hypothetical protein [Streptomyces sp. NBC_00047]
MSLLKLRRSARSVTVVAAMVAGLFLTTAPSANAATEGITGGCEWYGCGTLNNTTGRGLYATLEWGNNDNDRWANARYVPSGTSLGGNGTDVDGVYISGGCSVSGVIYGGAYNYPVVWYSGWHKIRTNETASLWGINC